MRNIVKTIMLCLVMMFYLSGTMLLFTGCSIGQEEATTESVVYDGSEAEGELFEATAPNGMEAEKTR